MAKRFDLKGYLVSDDDKWIYDLLEINAVSHKQIIDFLSEANGEDVDIVIDSPGGLVRIGSDIYSELRKYAGNSTAYILGISASASTVAMLGAKKVVSMPTARYFMHNAQGSMEGDYRDMRKAATDLKVANESIINAYELKTKMPRDQLQAIMDKNTWMTAQEAKGYGFVDEIALKDGESLSGVEIAAALDLPFKAPEAINIQKLHEIAATLKAKDEKPPAEQSNEIKCADCGMPYGGDDWTDTVLPDDQWLMIHPEGEGGILCANCIIKRASKLKGITRADMKFDITNDSGGESRPVSDSQKKRFRELRKKINT